MTTRERFVRVLTGQDVDRVPFMVLFGGERCARGNWVEQYPGLGNYIDELLAAARRCPAFAPHLHLPLQSGADSVLARMNRQYDAATFLRAVERLREAFDRPALTADVIVGFPGETDAEFEQTLRVASESAFAAMHIFPFSPIPGTAAWSMRKQHTGPSNAVVYARVRELTALADELSRQYRRQFIGETVEAVIEKPSRGTPQRQAMTDRHVTIFFDPTTGEPAELTGLVRRFRVIDDGDGGVIGKIISPHRTG